MCEAPSTCRASVCVIPPSRRMAAYNGLMAAPGRPNTCVTPSRRKIATAASAAVIRGIFLLLSFVSAGQLADQLEQRRMVQPAVSLRLQRRDQLRDGGAERD